MMTLRKVRILVIFLPEVVVRLENCSMFIFTVERELGECMCEDTANQCILKICQNFGVVCLLLFLFACLLVCSYNVLSFLVLFIYLFLTIVRLTFTQTLRLQALSQ